MPLDEFVYARLLPGKDHRRHGEVYGVTSVCISNEGTPKTSFPLFSLEKEVARAMNAPVARPGSALEKALVLSPVEKILVKPFNTKASFMQNRMIIQGIIH